MDSLLEFALDAHGGLRRWDHFNTLAAGFSARGMVWDMRQASGELADKTLEIDTHAQRLVIAPLGGPYLQGVSLPGRVVQKTLDGRTIDTRDAREIHLSGYREQAAWDPLHLTYFASDWLWTHLTAPFLFSYPGFESREIDSLPVKGEIWRRLEVRLPDYIPDPRRVQTAYFGPDGLLRRLDHGIAMLDGGRASTYPDRHRIFQGISMPTRAKVYRSDDAIGKVRSAMLFTLNLRNIDFG